MKKVIHTKRFLRDIDRVARRGYSPQDLAQVLTLLRASQELDRSYRPHKLKGEYKGCWECHIAHDWLLVWRHIDTETIELLRTGSHDDLFK